MIIKVMQGYKDYKIMSNKKEYVDYGIIIAKGDRFSNVSVIRTFTVQL
jgi:hypothetical protein